MKRIKADLCVIGAGSAGLSIAAAGAMLGQRIVLIEKHKMGGDCLNTGCVPSKALIAAAAHAAAIKAAPEFGVSGGAPQVDYGAVMDHVHHTIAHIAPVDSVARYRALGCTVIEAEARFISRKAIVAGDTEITARRFVIATGSRAGLPPVPGLADTPHFTNETFFENREKPSHLIVIGGGPIGLEMAQAHQRLGIHVTVLEAAKALSKDDPETAAIVLARLRQEGVDLREGARIQRAERCGAGVKLTLADGTEIEGSHLLVAAGRVANVEGLGLEKAGVAFTARGVTVDARLRSSNRRIYAAGDVAGGPQFTHAASAHAGVLVPNIFLRLPLRFSPASIPWATYTDPELAQAGLTEAAARAQGIKDLRILRWPLAENDRAVAERERDGLIKVVARRNGKILGVSIAAPHAGDLIQPWVLALSQGLTLRAFTKTVAPYPTLGEISKRAAGQFYAGALFSPFTRRLVRWLARFG